MKEIYVHIDKMLLPFSLTDGQKEQLEKFEALVLEWNKKLNLTAITGRRAFRYKHIYDSLTCLQVMLASGASSVIDIGTGAGFPGIPLKIAHPEMHLTLVESVKKKADFCRLAVETLRVENVDVIAERAETIGQDTAHREQYDWAVARAVAPLAVLAEYLLPLVRPGGHALAQKGASSAEELAKAKNAIKKLGGEIDQVIPIELPEAMGRRTLITIKKVKRTPAQYPRRPGTPKKKPLV